MYKGRPLRRSDFPKFPFKAWILEKDYTPKQITLVRSISGFCANMLQEPEGWTHNWNTLHLTREEAIRAGYRKINFMTEKTTVPTAKIEQYRQALMRAEAEIAAATV